MDRRFALVAVWSLFAGASVGVGFGAAGLVGGPFAPPGLDGAAPSAGNDATRWLMPEALHTATPTGAPVGTQATPESSREATAAGTADAVGTSGRPGGGTPSDPKTTGRTSREGTPTTQASSSTSSPSGSTSSEGPQRSATAEKEIQTRGGYVRAGCAAGSLSVAASPAMGWTLDHIEEETADFAEVRFLQVGGASGRVDVEARCTAQGPTLAVVKDEDGSSGPGPGDAEE